MQAQEVLAQVAQLVAQSLFLLTNDFSFVRYLSSDSDLWLLHVCDV